MNITHVAALRQAAPGSPSMREIARRMKVSVEAVRKFEAGHWPLSPQREALYAKTIGASQAIVHRMFELTALQYHRTRVAELSQGLKDTGAKSRPSRVLQPA